LCGRANPRAAIQLEISPHRDGHRFESPQLTRKSAQTALGSGRHWSRRQDDMLVLWGSQWPTSGPLQVHRCPRPRLPNGFKVPLYIRTKATALPPIHDKHDLIRTAFGGGASVGGIDQHWLLVVRLMKATNLADIGRFLGMGQPTTRDGACQRSPSASAQSGRSPSIALQATSGPPKGPPFPPSASPKLI
jgi:hypothetical protein